MLERNIRRTMIQNQGDLMVFIERPISLGLFILTIVVVLIPVFLTVWKRMKPRRAETTI
jgi:putative tricarboxylic transport membrane protein